MTMIKIIATLGPASSNEEILNHFKKHSVEIARLNGSHGLIDEHLSVAQLAMNAGLDLMLDLPGPKIRVGLINDKTFNVKMAEKIFIEKEKDKNGMMIIDTQTNIRTIPCQFAIEKSTNLNDIVYIDDGKLQFRVLQIEEHRIQVQALNSGPVKSHKGINLPYGKIQIDFLTENDLRLIENFLPKIKPKYVASSFVKTVNDIRRLKSTIQKVLFNENDYFPKIVTKIEMAEAIEPLNIHRLIKESDMIMIARGDLALETTPVHIRVPFIQTDLANYCRKQKKPFIVATQILESMIFSPVPTRAEVSDLYRAIVIDRTNYVMLSGEAAVGQYPKECVTLMHDFILFQQSMQKEQARSSNRSFTPFHAEKSLKTRVSLQQSIKSKRKRKNVQSIKQK